MFRRLFLPAAALLNGALINPMNLATLIQGHNANRAKGRHHKRPRKRLNTESAIRRSLSGAKGLRP